MMANSLTKGNEYHQLDHYFSRGGRYRITYDPNFMSARKRKAKGIPMLSDATATEDKAAMARFDALMNNVEEAALVDHAEDSEHDD